MKKNVNNRKNNKSRVVSAVAMLMVSVLTLSTATYAWFTMSKQVEVDGIELTATAPDNILISSETGKKDGNHVVIEDYASKITLKATKDMFKGGTTTAIAATDKLLPASSVAGINGTIFQTPDIQDNGAAKDDAKFYTATNATDATELYYVDVPLYILTTGAKDVKVELDEAQSAIETKEADQNIFKAVRFAVLNADSSANVGGTYENTAAFFTDTMSTFPVKSIDGTTATLDDSDKATLVTGTETTLADTQLTLKGTDTAISKTVADGNGTATYEPNHVTVRVWIEGQNSNCITKNANQSFKIKLVFKAVA